MFLCKFTNHISKPLNKAWKSFIKNCPVGRLKYQYQGTLLSAVGEQMRAAAL